MSNSQKRSSVKMMGILLCTVALISFTEITARVTMDPDKVVEKMAPIVDSTEYYQRHTLVNWELIKLRHNKSIKYAKTIK